MRGERDEHTTIHTVMNISAQASAAIRAVNFNTPMLRCKNISHKNFIGLIFLLQDFLFIKNTKIILSVGRETPM